MLLRGSIAALAVAVSSLTACPNARADEAYVCDANRVVYVKPGELESMKKTDPCIAGYYGLTVAAPPSKGANVPMLSGAKNAQTTPAIEFKTLEAPENHASGEVAAPYRVAMAGVGVVQAHRGPPVAALDTDFRNVRLINAGPDSDGWYRHLQ